MTATSRTKTKRCKVCRSEFSPRTSLHVLCGRLECALAMTDAKQAKEAAQKAKEERAQLRERIAKARPRAWYVKEAQKAFNAFIRTRDAALPCICCGQWGADESWKPGGQWDAGHFLGVGAYPELRYVEDNCHKQLKSCNAGSGKYARKGRTVAQEYRERLIQKIGIERVEYLEWPHEPKHYSIDDLKAIRAEYVAKRKALEKAND